MNINAIDKKITAVGERLLAVIKANPYVAGFAATAVLGSAWVIHDFREWKAFGTGGTPGNMYGYCRMTICRIVFAWHIPRQINPETLSNDGPSYLKVSIPPRSGGRPRIMPRILPQRQYPEPIDPAAEKQLMSLMCRLAERHPKILEVKPSETEGKTADGLYARTDNEKVNPLARTSRELHYEIAHAHPRDKSLHVWLSDPDARKVIEAGWGQRFSLPMVPSGWTMVYAPRNEAELEVIDEIVKAGVAWVTGITI